MRKLILSALSVALIVLALGSTSTADPTVAQDGVGFRYQWAGTDGVLTIVHAEGEHFAAYRADGSLAAFGVVDSNLFSVPVTNCGFANAAILHVRVGAIKASVPDNEWIWE